MSDINIKRRGLMLVLSAPSGTGKTTLSRLICKNDSHIKTSISMTTRLKRKGEEDNVDYVFTDKEMFKRMVDAGKFLEYAEVFGNYYGSPRDKVEEYLANGEDVLFDIEWNGFRQLVTLAREDVVSVFLLPPSKEVLFNRLKTRGRDSVEVMKGRVDKVNYEISHWHEYDYIIINRNLDETLQKLLSILRAERLKKPRRTGLPEFIQNIVQQDMN